MFSVHLACEHNSAPPGLTQRAASGSHIWCRVLFSEALPHSGAFVGQMGESSSAPGTVIITRYLSSSQLIPNSSSAGCVVHITHCNRGMMQL